MLLSHIYKYIVFNRFTKQGTKLQVWNSGFLLLHQKSYFISSYFLAGNYMFKVNNRNTRKRCDDASGAVLVSLLLTLNIFHTLF